MVKGIKKCPARTTLYNHLVSQTLPIKKVSWTNAQPPLQATSAADPCCSWGCAAGGETKAPARTTCCPPGTVSYPVLCIHKRR